MTQNDKKPWDYEREANWWLVGWLVGFPIMLASSPRVWALFVAASFLRVAYMAGLARAKGSDSRGFDPEQDRIGRY